MYTDDNAMAVEATDQRVKMMEKYVELERALRDAEGTAAAARDRGQKIRAEMRECRESIREGIVSDEPEAAMKGGY